MSKATIDISGPSTMVITGTSGIASHYPDSETAYQVTIKNVSPRILWLHGRAQTVSLDKFLSRVWYEDKGDRMRGDPLVAKLLMNKPTDGKSLSMPLKIIDPRYDSRAKTLIFRAESVEPGMGENKLTDIPSSFLVSDIIFDANRFSGSEYLMELK